MPLTTIPNPPAQPDRPMLRAFERDVEAMITEQSVLAVYLPVGIADGTTPGEVKVVVSAKPAKPVMGSAAQGGLSGRSAAVSGEGSRISREGTLSCAAYQPQRGETMAGSSGVGSLGGVLLKTGDRFVVPGWVLGSAENGLLVQVGPRPRQVDGMWTAEMTW